MKPLLLTVSMAVILAAGSAGAQIASPGPGTTPNNSGAWPTQQSTDARFIDHVARDGRAEVELGQLAQQKSSNADVKAFAQHLVTDHDKANKQLMSIAQKDGVQPPNGVGRENSDLRTKLEKLSGPAFDRAFLQAQVDDHQKDIQYFQQQANTLKNPELKAFAQQTIPVMERHLQMAQQLVGQIGSTGSSNQSGKSKQ